MHKLLITILSCAFLLMMGATIEAQTTPVKKKYWVLLKDKKGTNYSVDRPLEFLSPRAMQRRFFHRVKITEQDLPISSTYIESLVKKGAKVHNTSKWVNAVAIVADSLTAVAIGKEDFVTDVFFIGKHREKTKPPKKNKRPKMPKGKLPVMEAFYGLGENQIAIMNGQTIHRIGHNGQDMLVSVMDGGFSNVDVMPFFDSLRQENRLFAGHDFVDNDKYLWESSSHGSQVLSTMASYIPGMFVGTGFGATYICMKTEDTFGEYRVEEINWIAAVEAADSAGVDVINSSLGYTTFDDPAMNYDFTKLNGQTSYASKAADIAYEKGILLVNSAGNSGSGKWKYIGVPSDAKNMLTVGATDYYGDKASFSSFGPSADGRVKPEVATIGQGSVVGSISQYNVTLANGTSFSSPIMAGMVTSLWSGLPGLSNEQIKQGVIHAGHQADQPDDKLGYGIPDFALAYLFARHGIDTPVKKLAADIYLGLFESNKAQLALFGGVSFPIKIEVTDLFGRIKYTDTFLTETGAINYSNPIPFQSWTPDIYRINLIIDDLKFGWTVDFWRL